MHPLPFLLIAAAGSGALATELPIRLLYEERPPFVMRTTDGGVEGLAGTPAGAAFRKAGIAFVWEPTSMSRQVKMLRDGEANECVVGWHKTSERESFAKFTLPVYKDGPIVGVARADYVFAPGNTLASGLATPGLRVLVRDKYSYGERIDAMFQRVKPTLIASNQPNLQLVELIKAGRADLMLASQDEANLLIRHAPSSQKELTLVRFADIAQGVERYIVCSRKVPDEVINKLNKAIAAK